jgi:DNA-binding transcriptional MerR regulator
MTDERPLRSGALAAEAGVSTDTLRYYERHGLLPRPPRDRNGYRRYPAAALTRVRVIQRALDAGFTVAELARVLKERDAGGAPCRDVLAIARTRLDELDKRIRSLMTLRRELRQVIEGWGKRLEETPPGRRAGLLDKLGAINPSGGASRRAGLRRATRASARNPNRAD